LENGWGNNPTTKQQEEIDIVAYAGSYALFAECKWQNDKVEVDIDVLNKLIERASIFNFEHKYYAIFSKSGFTGRIEKAAVHLKNVLLYTIKEMNTKIG